VEVLDDLNHLDDLNDLNHVNLGPRLGRGTRVQERDRRHERGNDSDADLDALGPSGVRRQGSVPSAAPPMPRCAHTHTID